MRADERIPGIRTIPEFPDIYAEGEKERIFAGHFIHEQGRVCNISSDYEGVLREGLLPRRARAEQTLAEGRGDRDFLEAAIETIDAVIAFADRYAEALPDGEGLKDAMRHGAKDFLNALRMLRMLHLALWASNVYHNTVGRFDQYMWPDGIVVDVRGPKRRCSMRSMRRALRQSFRTPWRMASFSPSPSGSASA